MILSDISIKRPVFASVLSLLLVAFGLVAFDRLPLREFPDIDPPVVSVETTYLGAAANVVENRITRPIEDRIAGVEGIRFIESESEDGRSRINIEFDIARDVDGAANDIRDRVATVLDDLPEEADPPEIQKVDSNQDVIMWLNLVSEDMTIPELTDYARRYLVDRFSVLDGVARVRLSGARNYAMRIWLDRRALAARNLSVADVESALRSENVELPAGSLESVDRQFTVRLQRAFLEPKDFERLVLARGEDGYLIRLGDVARVGKGTDEDRTMFRGNTVPQLGIGIIKQSTANTIAVADAARAAADRINPTLPAGMSIKRSYDTSVFISGAIKEVYRTLAVAILLVVLVIYLFLGSARATLVPAATVPVSLIATFLVLLAMGFSINLLTLLALVLAIGLVVDDSIVVLENIHRRMEEFGESRLVAAFRGTRQVSFAVIATTLVLVSVFVPTAFMQGDLGRLFLEFAFTLAAAVGFSSLVALSLAAMLASQVLPQQGQRARLSKAVDSVFSRIRDGYSRLLTLALKHKAVVGVLFVALIGSNYLLLNAVPGEYTPKEDRGAFFVLIDGPEGASFGFMQQYMDEIERRMMPLVEAGEINRLLMRSPRAWGIPENFNSGVVITILSDWSQRRSAWEIMDEVQHNLADLPGVRTFIVMRQAFGSRVQKPVQFVLGGGSYQELAQWRDTLLTAIEESNPGLTSIDWDYKETNPQLRIDIDYDRAADLGVQVSDIGRTLETMLGSRRVTTYLEAGEEYDVIVEGERAEQRTPTDLTHIYVRSSTSGELIPLANVVRLREMADSVTLNRYNRTRAITLQANMVEGLSLGEALDYLTELVATELPETAVIDFKGQSRDYVLAGESVTFVLLLGALVVYLVLAAQFESWINPLVIMLTVPLAIAGALLGLYLGGFTLNIYSQIGLIMLVGLSAKNGILIVEFANQLRDGGQGFREALIEATRVRFRPIVMTGITTAAGSLPLLLSSGAGTETRVVIGTVILCGVLAATLFTLFIVPVAYDLLARRAGLPGETARRLQLELPGSETKAREKRHPVV